MRPLKIIGLLICFEGLSLIVFLFPSLETIIFSLICLAVFILSLIDLRYGVLAALGELFIGGMGYLFVLPTGGLNLSIRMGLFLVLLAATVIEICKERKIEFLRSKLFTVYCLLFTFIIIGLIFGYFRGRNPAFIFFDVNGFFFLGYLLVFYQAFKKSEDLKIIWPVFWLAGLWLAVKTLLFFFIFTHGFTALIPSLYQWIRDTGVGEITPAPGGFYRVFFQSQIYLVMGFILLVSQQVRGGELPLFFLPKGRPALGGAPQVSAKKNNGNSPPPSFSAILSIFLFSAILLSFSRSFWAGLIIVLPIMFFTALFFLRTPVPHLLKSIFWTLGVGLAGFLLVLLVSYFPYPQRVGFSFANLLGERALSVSDAAAATRWAELAPLWQEIKKHWLFGSGFGATVTFKTQDPRILSASPTGEYTTYAFEWGWLDVWLKIGFIGLLVYWSLLWKIISFGWKKIQYPISNIQYFSDKWLKFGLIMSIFVLFAIHIFTPYLNHPLGLGWVMVVGLMIERRSFQHSKEEVVNSNTK